MLPETVNQARHFHPTISIAQYVMQGPEAIEGLYWAIGGQLTTLAGLKSGRFSLPKTAVL